MVIIVKEGVDEVIDKLGKQLKKNRKEMGKKIEDISKEVGLGTSMINHIERGARRINKNKVKLFAKSYGVDENFILENNYLETRETRYKKEKIKICENIIYKFDNLLNDIDSIKEYIMKEKIKIEIEKSNLERS